MHELEARLGYQFQNRSLLEQALSHSSWSNERGFGRLGCNERLEFLGDSILGFVVAETLYERFPNLPEGDMTRIRAELVCEESLAETAGELGLGEYLRLGKGEEQGGGRTRTSIIADAVEAILAAIYLDGGEEAARKMLSRFILPKLRHAEGGSHDFKTALQEAVQRKGYAAPTYRLCGESGPDHDKVFYSEVLIEGVTSGQGSGKSKKEAEQAAAKTAWQDWQEKEEK